MTAHGTNVFVADNKQTPNISCKLVYSFNEF